MTDIPERGSGERGLFYYNPETGKIQSKPVERKETKAPTIRTDEMDPLVSHATDEGLVFTSKAKYYRHLKEHNMAVKEKGMYDTPPPTPAERISFEDIREAAEKAYYDVKYQRVPFSEKEKEVCLREQRALEQEKQRHR